jgi:hypothetical protein
MTDSSSCNTLFQPFLILSLICFGFQFLCDLEVQTSDGAPLMALDNLGGGCCGSGWEIPRGRYDELKGRRQLDNTADTSQRRSSVG